jgi:fatty-acid desaturase
LCYSYWLIEWINYIMNIKSFDPLLQTFLLFCLVILNAFLLYNYASFFIVFSIILLKIYQTLGGGGVHLWACHGIKEDKVRNKSKFLILFFWLLCGISRASYFCKYHILHHSKCDKEGDPHSPNDHSALTLSLGLWSLTAKDKDKFIDDKTQAVIDKSFNRIGSHWLDKYYYTLIFSILSISFLLSPIFCLYVIALPMLLNIIDGNFFFVYYFHKGGKVRNIPWVSYWILNSGNHRSHHIWLK